MRGGHAKSQPYRPYRSSCCYVLPFLQECDVNIGCRLSGSPEQGVKTLIISGPGGVQDGGLQDHCHCQYSQREDQPGLLHAAGNV